VTAHAVLMLEHGGRGGVADYTQALIGALAARGRPVVLVTARDHRYHPVPGATSHAIVPWVRGRSRLARAVRRARLGPVANALGYLAVLPRIAALARRSALVHMQGDYFPPLAALTALTLRALGVPVVHTAHGTFDRRRSHTWSRRILQACARTTIVHARADLPRLTTRAARRAAVIPHGEYGGLARRGGHADPDAARAELGIANDTLVALLFGQLRADKGIRDLLEATALVPGVHALIAGEEAGGLAAAADALARPALAGRVTVREGFLEMPAVARLFAAADVAVLPYRAASQSGVLLLAYGFARPVVAYPVGGLAEAIDDGTTGWLSVRPDPAALAETLRSVVAAGRDDCRRRGAAGERLARDRYSWTAIARLTDAVYQLASTLRTAAE
jgi:glycosyltransferase involved in cell wall biosynthesis